MSWEVQHYTVCGGWVNTWQVDDQPQRFATREDAQAELDQFLAEILAEIEAGDRDPDAGYSADEFRVVPVGCKTFVVSASVTEVYTLRVAAPSGDEAVAIAKAQLDGGSWDGWKPCGIDGEPFVQLEWED